MTTITLRRRGSAIAVAAAVAASTLLGLPAAHADEVPAPTHGVTVDYFDDVYDNLGAGSVFETVTIERFEYILKNKPGNFAFFIGDPGNASSQATIGHIDAVAKQLDVDKIYNFTPKLDGGALNVWDVDNSGLRALGRTYYNTTGSRLLTDYLNKDQNTTFTKNESTDPYLFVYDKDREVGGQPDRIVAALSGAKTAADLDTPSEVDAYKAEVATVLDSVGSLATNTNFEFQRDEVNRRHTTSYPNATTHGGNILEASDDADGFRIQTLTYPELVHLLQQPGDIPILFGGTWCHNTRAIIKFANADAQKYGIRTVYNFDFSLFSSSNGSTNYDHIRDNPNAADEGGTLKVARPSHLYGDLVNTYLSNAVTQYRKNGDPGSGGTNFVSYYPGGDTTKPVQEARKIQVGHLLTYNKDHQDPLGNDAPVVDQAIRQNDNGGNTEHMTEWWYTSGRELPLGQGPLGGGFNPVANANQLQTQRLFAKEAVDEIDTVLKGVASDAVSSTTTVSGIGGVEDPVIAVGGTPAITVSVSAPDYSPFISLTGAGEDVTPASGVGKPRGFVAVLDGATKVAEGRLKRDGTVSITLPPQTAGPQSYTVSYLGRGDAIQPSQKVLEFDVTGDPSETTLTGPSTLVFGAGGEYTATVTEGATGTVKLNGLPGDPLEAPVVDGEAVFTLPASTPVATHSLVASYSGDDTFGVSSSEAHELTVTKAVSTVAPAVSAKPYGTSSTVKVTAAGPHGQLPTGQATVTVSGKAYTANLVGGIGTVALPKTLAPSSYTVLVIYGGDANHVASSTTATLKVGKGTVKGVSYKRTKTPTSKKAGKATITVSRRPGLATPTGKVTVKIKKGKSTKTITTTLSGGKRNIKLPKLKKGTWKIKITYKGDTRYAAKASSTYTLKIKK